MGIAREMHGIVNEITESATWSRFCCRGFLSLMQGMLCCWFLCVFFFGI